MWTQASLLQLREEGIGAFLLPLGRLDMHLLDPSYTSPQASPEMRGTHRDEMKQGEERRVHSLSPQT